MCCPMSSEHDPLTPNVIRRLSSEETEGTVNRVLSKLEESGRNLDIIAVMANWAPGFRSFVTMSDALLFKGVLAPVNREVAVLLTAHLHQLAYEWKEHLPMAREAGVSDEQVSAIAEDRWRSDPDAVFTAEQRMIIEVIATLVSDRRLSTDLWSRACDRLSPEAALELLMAYAWWGGFVRVVIESVLPLSDTPLPAEPG
jgi:4-carboxymuconolactone decarboxylase